MRPETDTTASATAAPPPADPAERIKALTEFVARLAPAIGERRDGHGTHLADDDARPAVVVARDDALVTAFEAIERLARGC
jgi:hypothetical protein